MEAQVSIPIPSKVPRARTGILSNGRLGKIVLYGIVALAILWTLFPLYWLAITALKPYREFSTYPPTFWPQTFTLDNLYEGFINKGALASLKDSGIVAVGTLVVAMAVGVPTAYSIARFRTGGTDLSFTILSMRFMPPIVPVVALYTLSNWVHLFDTYWLLILVNSMVNIPFAVWIMKGFFEEIPYAIEEAAQVDGASWLKIMWDHILPLSAPGLVATSLFCFIFSWNELLFATILTGKNVMTLTRLLPGLNVGHVEPDWGAVTSVGLVVVIPIFILCWYMQKYIVRGMTYGAIRQ